MSLYKKYSTFILQFWLFSLFIPATSLCGEYDPGPPELTYAFLRAETVFLGVVKSVSHSAPEVRGDTSATVSILESFKGELQPNSLTTLNFNSKCPKRVRESDCVIHTINIEVGDLMLFFIRAEDKTFTSKHYGTRPFREVEHSFAALRSGKGIEHADAIQQMTSWGICFFGKLILRHPVVSQIMTEAGNGYIDVEVTQPITRGFEIHEKIKLSYRLSISGQKKDLHNYFASPGTQYLFVLYPFSNGRIFSITDRTISQEDLDKEAMNILKSAKREISNDIARKPKTSIESGGFIPGFAKHIDALKSHLNYLSHRSFDVGYQWNPDD